MISKEPVRNLKELGGIMFMSTQQQRPVPYEVLLSLGGTPNSFEQYLLGGIAVWTTYSGFQIACQGPVVIRGSEDRGEE